MNKRVNLLEGSIIKSLLILSGPIVATSLLQMAYNMVDMIWIGRVGSNAVAAIGASAMFVNLSMGLGALARIGSQVKIAQNYGAGKLEEAAIYARHGIQISVIVGIAYSIVLLIFYKACIAFFMFQDATVIADGEHYLRIMGAFILLYFINPLFTAMITATGNSKTPFQYSSLGLIINLVLDPVLIFGLGPFPVMGVEGAAWATVFAQMVVSICYINYLRHDQQIFHNIKMFAPMESGYTGDIIRISIPIAIQGIMFTGISMTIGRLVASFGAAAIAVQKVGIQVESVSYMAADGFASATNSFIGQNYGAHQFERAKRGYKKALLVIMGWGLLTSLTLVFGAEPIFRIFIQETDVVPLGINYLRILGYSQLFMCMEILTAGAFSAYGNTLPPSIVSITLTAARIPAAIILSATALGLNGVWWGISISSVFKGIIMVVLFFIFMRRLEQKQDVVKR